jgi:hypothetical protein
MANVGVPQGGQFPELSVLEARLQKLATGQFANLANTSQFYSPNDLQNPAVSPAYPRFAGDTTPQRVYPATNEEPVNFPSRSSIYSEIPTSSSNIPRPRTVAAAYKGDKVNDTGTLTVVFRDGTYYNYYDVKPTEWELFHGQLSKGPMLNPASRKSPTPGFLMSKPRGEADVSNIAPDVLEALHTLAIASQQRRPNRRYKEAQARQRAKWGPHPNPTVSQTARQQAGKNPATANKQRRP